MKATFKPAFNAGINLLGTEHAGKSAAQLRRDDPTLADKWAREMADYNRATKAMGLVGR